MDVVQVIPKDDYQVFVYFADGIIKKYSVAHLAGNGVFACLKDKAFCKNNCTVLNGTLAWTLDGSYSRYNCIDIDPYTIYETGETVPDPLSL